MAKRVHTSNSCDEVSVKRTKVPLPTLVHETNTYRSVSPNNSDTSDSGNELNSIRSVSKSKLGSVCLSEKRSTNKSKCESKNAVMARINRIKKKKYIEGLESKNVQLEAENKELRGSLDAKNEEITALKREISNLKNVIRNRTEIGTLLKCIHFNTDIKVTSSLLDSFSYSATARKASEVLKSNVSQENARDTLRRPHCKSPFWSSSDEEGKTPIMCNNYCPSPSVLNVNSALSNEFVSPTKIKEEFSFDHDPELDHNYTAEPSKVSRFEVESPNLLPELGLELGDFSRCGTPTRGTNSEFAPYFADEDLGFNLGICLHVANKQVSLEFCDSCNHKASLLKN